VPPEEPPACLATIVQLPAEPDKVTRTPAIVQTPLAVNETASPEEAVAEISKAGAVRNRASGWANDIDWAVATVTEAGSM